MPSFLVYRTVSTRHFVAASSHACACLVPRRFFGVALQLGWLLSTSVRLVELRAACLQVHTVGTFAFLDGRRLHDAGPFLLSLLLSPLVCL